MGSEASRIGGTGRCVLLAREEDAFADRLAKALQEEQFAVVDSATVPEALALIEGQAITDAILEIRLHGESVFPLIRRIREVNRKARVVVVTAFPSIATAVQAIKLGACDYLPLPIDPLEAVDALLDRQCRRRIDSADTPLSVNRIEWEHINRVLTENRGNISAAARRLGMHRRTLQRKIGKHPGTH